jgi:response regulator NasT
VLREDRELIERAKGVLMRRAGLEEEAAFRRLQKLARHKNLKLVDVAEIVLAAEESMPTPTAAKPARRKKKTKESDPGG